MKKAEIIFIPAPGVGHVVSAVEFAKLLVSRDERISISILIMKLPYDTGVAAFTQQLKGDAFDRIAFIDIPALDDTIMKELASLPHTSFLHSFIEGQRTHVRDVVNAILNGSESSRLGGFVIDMFCTPMIDVANEFNIPVYAFFTSGAAFLGLVFYIQILIDNENKESYEYKDSDVELSVPSYINPVPAKFLPSVMLSKESSDMLTIVSRGLRMTKAIVVNSFFELEAHAVKSLTDDENTPHIYPVGPVINLKRGEARTSNQKSDKDIISWLDSQPPSSVVFLCFGSMGSFDIEQVMEIARALELSGQRFLWSLRRPSQEKMDLPKDYIDYSKVLPEGFLERTSAIGKVIGWAPQVAILSHPSVGGFVSHCGWNSTLESIWCGVPIATWPMHAEQQTNAFQLVKDLGMAVEIKMDYRKDNYGTIEQSPVVTAEDIGRGIRRLMNGEGEMRMKVKKMKETCRKATAEGGSSYTSLGQFIEDVMNNIREGS